MSYTINMSRKERIFLDSNVIIGLFSGEDDAERILGRIISQSLYINEVVFSEVVYKAMVLKFLEIAEYLNIHYKSLVQLFPLDKNRLEVKVVD